MDWNGNYRNLVTTPNTSFSFLYNYNPCPVPEMKQREMTDTNYGMVSMMGKSNNGSQEKKKRLTSGQQELLERSFQEEVKLDPDRKMKLSQELGLQPRQIAIWFQNRRARWKAKQLESLYDGLKQEFDVISREKQMLQEEVLKLKAILRDQTSMKQLSDGSVKISGEETVESTLDGVPSSEKTREGNQQEMADCSYLPDIDVSPPFWGALCSYPE